MVGKKNKNRSKSALTLLEMVIALSIMCIIFATIIPQLKTINDSWASKQANAEVNQNARVAIDQINRSLTTAANIIAVSESTETNGYIEFKDNNNETWRFDIAASNYIEFGPVASLSDLAGPVSKLQFTCYDDNDLDTPVDISTDGVDGIRYIEVEVVFTNPGFGQDRTFTTASYLRTNYSTGGGTDITPGALNAFSLGREAVNGMCKIDDTHYIWSNGYEDEYILYADKDTGVVTPITNRNFAGDERQYPSYILLDAAHVLKASCRGVFDGYASVLTINSGYKITENAGGIYFDSIQGQWPSLTKIDDTHYLCTYAGKGDDGMACVLVVDPSDWSVTFLPGAIEWDNSLGQCNSIFKIDDEHYLCVYRGRSAWRRVLIITVDTATYALSAGPVNLAYPFTTLSNSRSDIYQIDATHYLVHFSYDGPEPRNEIVILTVNDFTWTVTASAPFKIDDWAYRPSGMGQFNATDYVVLYSHGSLNEIKAVGVTVDTSDWSITKGTPIQIDLSDCIYEDEVWATIDDTHVLCVYTGDSDSFGIIFEGGSSILP